MFRFFHTTLLLIIWVNLNSQNNGIFYGGLSDGASSSMILSIINNSIFSGDIGDGHESDIYVSVLNNNIFPGNSGDGYNFNFYIQSNSNTIFNGYLGNGYSSLSIKTIDNNPIYKGGQSDGYNYNGVSSIIINPIFTGGQNDGYSRSQFYIQMSNDIYAGGKSDGYDENNINKILWEGNISSEWNLAGNWNLNRIPTSDDFVEIKNGKLNYPSMDQPHFNINEAGIYNYICGSLLIHDMANIITGNNVFITNSGEINIHGLWKAMNTSANSFINKSTGKLIIGSTGLLEIKN